MQVSTPTSINPVLLSIKNQSAIDSGMVKVESPVPTQADPVRRAEVQRQEVQTNRLPSIASTAKPEVASTADPLVTENAVRKAISANVIPSTTVSISALASTFAANPTLAPQPTPLMPSATAIASAYRK